jgi:hypothetical protein
MVWCKNQWMGFGTGLWDLSEVRKHFDFVLEEELVRIYGSIDKHPVLATTEDRCEINCDNIGERVSLRRAPYRLSRSQLR